MALHEAQAVLKATGFGQVIFLLDASQRAAQHQQAIITLIREVLSALPAGIERTLYFLGNPSAYKPDHFDSRAVQQFADNRRRASLATPILEKLPMDNLSTIVIIGSGPVFDLEDLG